MIPFVNLRAVQAHKQHVARVAFLNRHRAPSMSVPLFTFVLGFTCGVTLLVVAFKLYGGAQ